MKFFLFILSTLLIGCSQIEGGSTPDAVGIELSKRMIFLSEPHPDNELYGTSAYELPYDDTIRIKGNGGYVIEKVKSVQLPSGVMTQIETEVAVVGDTIVVLRVTGPSRNDYAANSALTPSCEDVYTVIDREGNKTSFGVRDTYRVGMPDISEATTITEQFLQELNRHCQ